MPADNAAKDSKFGVRPSSGTYSVAPSLASPAPHPDSTAAKRQESDCRCVAGHHTCGLPNPEEELILALARAEAAEHDLAMERSFSARAQGAEAENDRFRAALEQIAASPRPDGTYNLSREACEEIAREALRRGDT